SIMNAVPRSVGLPHAEVMKNDAIRRKIMRQAPPDAAIARLIQDRVDDLAAWVLRRPSAGLGLRNQRRDSVPVIVRQIGRVRHPCRRHATKTKQKPAPAPTLLFGHALRPR